MSELRRLEIQRFETPAVPAAERGEMGELKWIPLEQIVIDPVYQRDVGAAGKKNIKQIVERFHWALFLPVIVARRGLNLYAAIDGQHRAIAALTHGGIGAVPCWIIPADPLMEAHAFAVINGAVTALNPLHVFRAKVAAGNAEACRIVEVAKAAGVTIMANPTAGQQLKHGECQSPSTIGEVLARFGRDVTVTALRCITDTGPNPTMLRAAIIGAFAEVMATTPKWRTHKRLFEVIGKSGIKLMYSAALSAAAEEGGAVRAHLVKIIQEELRDSLGAAPFVPLPPTPAQKARAAAQKAGGTREQKRIAGRSGAAITNARPPAVKPTKPVVAANTKDAIADFIATKGVRKLEPGASGNPSLLVDYLRRRGVKIEWRQGKYFYRGKNVDAGKILALVDTERAKENLPPLKKAG